jgi:hypothetical protein
MEISARLPKSVDFEKFDTGGVVFLAESRLYMQYVDSLPKNTKKAIGFFTTPSIFPICDL